MAEAGGASPPAVPAAATLRKYLSTRKPIQHIGVNVYDMVESKRFYGDILGGEFVTEIDGITGDVWNTILNGTALGDGKKVPDLDSGDALHVAFYSFGNVAVELLRYYNTETGETFPGPVVGANEQGPAGMHICFNLSEDEDSTEFLAALETLCADMKNVSINRPELFVLPKNGAPLDGWCLAFMSGPNNERIEFLQLPEDSNAVATFNGAALRYRAQQFAKQSSKAIDHMVLMTLRKDLTEEELQQVTEEVFKLEAIPGILSFSFGTSNCPSRSGHYTHGLVVRHLNEAAAQAYQVHPEHVRVRDEVLSKVLDKSVPLPVIAFDVAVGSPPSKI